MIVPQSWLSAALVAYAIFFGVMMYLLWRECHEEYRRLFPAQSPSGGAEREVVEGVIASTELLTSPLSGIACVAWQLQYHTDSRLGWTRMPEYDCGQSVEFKIGEVGYRFTDGPAFSERFPARSSSGGVSGDPDVERVASAVRELPSHQALHRLDSLRRYEVREYRVERGESWLVTAKAVAVKDGVTLLEDACLAPGSKEQARQKVLRSIALTLVGGAIKLVIVPLGLWLLFEVLASHPAHISRATPPRQAAGSFALCWYQPPQQLGAPRFEPKRFADSFEWDVRRRPRGAGVVQ